MNKFFVFLLSFIVSSVAGAQSLPSLTYGKTPVQLNGTMKNIENVDSIQLSYQPVVGGKDVKKIVPVQDGKYTLTADVRTTQMATLTLLDSKQTDWRKQVRANVLLTPGTTLTLSVDGKYLIADSNKKAWKVQGCDDAFNTDLANYGDAYDVRYLYKDINGMGLRQFAGKTIDDYTAKLKELLDKALATLNADKRVGQTFRDYTTAQYQLMYGIMLGAGDKIMRYANAGKGDFTVTSDMYSDFLQMNPLASNGVLYGTFGVAPIKMAPELSKNTGHTFTAPACTRQLTDAQRLVSQIEAFHPLTDAQKDSLAQLVPAYDDIILAKNTQLLTQIEENKKNKNFSIQQLSDTLTGPRIFQEIVKRYKGRPVLVDFWATWCGPCCAAMKTVLPVKEEMWDKCAFVYVTGVTSPRATWNTMIPDIHGDHFYVTDKQWETLLSQFKAQGIPAYVIVNKHGQIQQHYVGFPGVDEIRQQLMKGMK